MLGVELSMADLRCNKYGEQRQLSSDRRWYYWGIKRSCQTGCNWHIAWRDDDSRILKWHIVQEGRSLPNLKFQNPTTALIVMFWYSLTRFTCLKAISLLDSGVSQKFSFPNPEYHMLAVEEEWLYRHFLFLFCFVMSLMSDRSWGIQFWSALGGKSMHRKCSDG